MRPIWIFECGNMTGSKLRYEAARQRAHIPRRRDMVARAIKLGVKIVAGTDIEYDDKYRLQDEIVEFVRLGLPPMASIKSATSVAAPRTPSRQRRQSQRKMPVARRWSRSALGPARHARLTSGA